MKHAVLRPTRLAAVALVAATLPFAAVATANASTTLSGCTVSPLRPYYDHTNSAGVKVIRYDMTVTCSGGRTITVDQHVHEQDGGLNGDDHITSSLRSRYFSSTDTVTMWLESSLPDTELGDEEMYQHVHFQITDDLGTTSPWTAWEDSLVQQFSK
ncbi:MAG: hypothetical protein ACOYBY_01920 [Dermatophilaceae bacterium]